jgi:hypothetical protein
MPYAIIYKGSDLKWHLPDCNNLTVSKLTKSRKLGGNPKLPDPHKSQMCKKCFHFLFNE